MIAHVFFTPILTFYFADCVRSRGLYYRGEQQSSSTGLTCLNWINTTRDYDVEMHPDSQTGKHTDVFSEATWKLHFDSYVSSFSWV